MTRTRSCAGLLLVLVLLAGCQGGFPWEDTTAYIVEGEAVNEAPPNTTVHDASASELQSVDAIPIVLNRTRDDGRASYFVPSEDEETVIRLFEELGTDDSEQQQLEDAELYVRDGDRIVLITLQVSEAR